MSTDYLPPVSKLLTYGEGQHSSPENWSKYLELGLGPDHIPELIRMATDGELQWADSDSLEVWAPLHAWRTLGQLRAEEAIEPLLSLFDTLEEDEWATEDVSLPGDVSSQSSSKFPHKDLANRKKTKNKMAKESRKKNRKRK